MYYCVLYEYKIRIILLILLFRVFPDARGSLSSFIDIKFSCKKVLQIIYKMFAKREMTMAHLKSLEQF